MIEASAPPLRFVRAGRRDLEELFPYYLRARDRSFLMDIYESLSFLSLESFLAFFSEQAEVWVQRSTGGIGACFILHDFQPENDLANLDILFFNGPVLSPGDPAAASLPETILAASHRRGLTRLQSFLLDSDEGIAGFLSSMGFREEGRLREHVCIGGKFHDVVLLARNEEDRT